MKKNKITTYETKNRRVPLVFKILVICYTLLFTVSYLSSDTSAYFNTQTTVSPNLTAGVWDEEKVELSFKNYSNQNINSCPSAIHANLKNAGNTDMKEAGTYEVFYIEKGDPSQNGQKLKEGSIPVLAQDEAKMLSYEADKSGVYIFKVTYSDDDSIWSKKFTLACNDTSEEGKKEKDKVNEKGQPEKTKEDQQSEKKKSKQSVNESEKEVNTTKKPETNKEEDNATSDEQGDNGKNSQSNVKKDENVTKEKRSDQHASDENQQEEKSSKKQKTMDTQKGDSHEEEKTDQMD